MFKKLFISLGLIAFFISFSKMNGVEAVVSNPKGYALQYHSAQTGALTPADSTTYYIGGMFTIPPITSATLEHVSFPRAGIVKAVYLDVMNTTADGTSEQATASFRLNNTTDTTISAAVRVDSASQFYSNTAMSVAVAAGDYFEIKFVAPVYATNPTDVIFKGIVYVDVP